MSPVSHTCYVAPVSFKAVNGHAAAVKIEDARHAVIPKTVKRLKLLSGSADWQNIKPESRATSLVVPRFFESQRSAERVLKALAEPLCDAGYAAPLAHSRDQRQTSRQAKRAV
jgi:hypothetical protein